MSSKNTILHKDRKRRHHSHHNNKSHRHSRHDHRRTDEKVKKFPTIPSPRNELTFKHFPNCVIEETPDFNTSNDEEEQIVEDKSELTSKSSTLDRLRDSSGTIDLGLHKTDIAHNYNNNLVKRRKMVNYDTTQPSDTSKGETNSDLQETIHTEFKIPFEFGDSGSSWRLMKLGKLHDDGNYKPSKEEIFQHYATLWDYELACIEETEIRERKYKPKKEWIYKPSKQFMSKRKMHVAVNKEAMKSFHNQKHDMNNTDTFANDANIIEIKKPNLKLSKSQKIKHELKLAHLTESEYGDDNGISVSRDIIESLTNSP